MSIATEITRINSAKADLKTSINAKGGTLTTETLESYPAAIDALPSGANINGTTTITGIYQETIAANDPVYVEDLPYVPPTPAIGKWEIADQTDLLNIGLTYTQNAKYSPDGVYLATTSTTAPNLRIYKRSGDTYNTGVTITTTPPGDASGIAWSTDGNYLFVAYISNGSYSIYSIYRYARSGDTFTYLGKTNECGQYTQTLEMDATNTYLVAGGDRDTFRDAPGTIVYKHDGLGGLTELYPDMIVNSRTTGWNPVSNQMVIAATASPYIKIYDRVGDVLTEVTTPVDTFPPKSVRCSFSHNGDYLGCATEADSSPSIYIYKRNGSTYEKLPNIDGDAGQGSYYFTWNESDEYMYISKSNTNGKGVFLKRVGDTFTRLGLPAFIDAENNLGADFSEGHLAIGNHGTSGGLQIVKTSVVDPSIPESQAITKIHKSANDCQEAKIETVTHLGYATEAGVVDDEKEVTIIWGVC